MPQFWFGFCNFFSGQTLYDSVIYQIFNMFYTSCPIMIYAVIDQEFDPKILVENQLNYYAQGMQKTLFSSKIFWRWFFFGTWQSLIITLFSFYCIERNFVNEDGLTQEFWETGTMIFGQCVLIANLKILGFSHTHNFLSIFVVVMSLLFYVFSLLIINNYKNSDLYGVIYPLFRTPAFHLGNFLILFSTGFIDFFCEMYQSKSFFKILMNFIL